MTFTPQPDHIARMVRRLHFIEQEAETARQYFDALENDEVHKKTLEHLPQLPELLDNYLKLMFEQAGDLRLALEQEASTEGDE